MLGHSHALSGAVIGLAAGLALHMPPAQTATMAVLTAGMALLPDLDKCGSSPARCLGYASELVAWTIGKLSGGHRHLTHSVIGVGLFTGLAWLACHYRADPGGKIGLGVLILLTVSAGLEALHAVNGQVADVLGAVAAAVVIWQGWGLALIPLAVLAGCCTHITGDMLTDSGCMLAYPFSRFRFHLLPEPLAFTTGTRPELLIVDPILIGLILALSGLTADPAAVAAVLH